MAYGTKHQTVDGVKLMGSNLFGTCSTAATTVAKTVTLDGFDVLVTGVTIHVKFTYANYGSNRTLTVGSTAARGIRCNGSSYVTWEAGAVISFTYDGEYWQMNDFYDTDTDTDTDTNTTYTISGSGNTVTLTGSNGTTSTATVSTSSDSYSLSRNGRTLTLSKNGSAQNTVTLPTVTTRVIERTLNLNATSYDSKVWNPDTVANWTPIGLVGFEVSGSNSYRANVWSAYFNADNKVYMQIYNPTSSAVSWTVRMRVLYAPNQTTS